MSDSLDNFEIPIRVRERLMVPGNSPMEGLVTPVSCGVSIKPAQLATMSTGTQQPTLHIQEQALQLAAAPTSFRGAGPGTSQGNDGNH
jgi:hypothetical protein